MFQQTLQKRVTFKSTLTTLALGVLSIATILYGGFALHPQKALALSNTTVNFQARLEGSGGNIAPDGLYNIRFKLYTVSSGGASVWSEAYYDANGVTAGQDNRVQVTNGYVSVALGSQTGFGVINWDQNMWVTMDIGGTTQTATPTYDGEMAPRLALTAVPYAFTAGQLTTANAGGTLFSTLSLVQPTVGSQQFQIGDQGAAGTYQLCVQGSTSGCTAASGSTFYIQNQNAGVQSASNFWISGTGRADTSVLTPVVDVASAGTLNIGTTTATTINIGKIGQIVNLSGTLQIVGTNTTSSPYKLQVGGTLSSSSTGSHYGFDNEVNFNPTGASVNNIYSLANIATITGSSLNVNSFYGAVMGIATGAGYTGLVSSGTGILINGPNVGGSQQFTAYNGLNIAGNTTNGGNTTGTITNRQLLIQGNTTGAGTGGTLNNYALNINQPNGTGGTTNNYGLYIQGNGSAVSGANYSIYNSSTAASYFAGDIRVGTTANANGYALNLVGTAAASTSILTPLLDTATGVTLNIGTAIATTINIGRIGQEIITPGKLHSTGNILIDGSTSNASKFQINGTVTSSATTNLYGFSNDVDFAPTGASLTNVWGLNNIANLTGSALNITVLTGTNTQITTGAGYTGTVTNARGLTVAAPTIGGTQLFTNYTGVHISPPNANTGNTSGTITNSGILIAASSPGAGSGGTLNNYGINLTQPAGAGAGTTNNYGLFIQGAGAGSANWSIYNSSTAASYFAGNILVGTTSNAGGYALNLVGTAAASTSLLTPLVDTASAVALNIGTATATTITIGRASQSVVLPGIISLNGVSTASNSKISVGGTVSSTATGSQYGIQVAPDFDPQGASLTAVYGYQATPNISGSALNIATFQAANLAVSTGAGYTGTVSSAAALGLGGPTISGANKFTVYRGINVGTNSTNGGNTTGTLSNYQIQIQGITAGAGAGGQVDNYGLNITQPNGTGGTTNNYGLYIQGAGSAVSGANYSIYNSSTAASYYAGDIRVGTTANANGYALNLVGTAAASTSVLTPLLDTPSGTTTLNIGTTNATVGINLNQNTTVASGKTLTVGGLTTVNQSTTTDSAQINSLNTSGTQTNGLLVARNGAGGTTTNMVNITNTAGTATNGLAFTGTFGTSLITAANFSVANSGAIVGVGINSGTGLLQGAGGLTITGTTNINATGTAATNIGNSTGVLTVLSGGASTWTNTSGNLSVTTATSGNITIDAFGTLALNGSNFDLATTGVVTLAGGQTADITTAAGASPTSLVFQPGNRTGASTTGASLTLQAGNDSGATSSTGGLLTLQGGNATGATAKVRGSVTIDAGTGTSGGAINIGPSNAQSVTITPDTSFTGNITANRNILVTGVMTTANNYRINVGGTLNSSDTGSQYGIQNQPNFNPSGASLTNLFGMVNGPTLTGSAININNFFGLSGGLNTTSGYTGQVSSAAALAVVDPTIGGSQLFSNYQGLLFNTLTSNTGNTSGTINNYQVRVGGITTAAGTSGTMNNYGIDLVQPAGVGTGTTNNYGLRITGNGSAATGANYSIYNSSTAASYLAGDLRIGTTANANGYALNLVGTAAASTSVLTPTLDVAAAGTLAIGNATATTINIGANVAAHTVAIASGAAVQNVTVGSTNGASSLALQAGTGNLTLLTSSSAAAVVVKSGVNSTMALEVNNAYDESVFQAGTVTTNLLKNSGFEAGTTNWVARGTTSSFAVDATAGNVYHGAQSQKAVVTAATSGMGTTGGQAAFTSNITATTQYQLTFYAKCSATFNTLTYGREDVAGTPVNSATTGACTTSWKQFTAHYTTGGTITNPDIYVNLGATTAGSLWIDAVSLVQTNTSAATNYDIGKLLLGGVISGPTIFQNTSDSSTALQLQNAAGTTILNVDTASSTIVFGSAGNTLTLSAGTYEPILAGTARHTKTLVLTPEYAGAVLDALSDTGGSTNCSTSNNGTMTSGFTATGRQNYYNWVSAVAATHCYDVVVQVPVPSDWAAWNGASSMFVYNSVGTDSTSVAVNVIDTTGTNDTAYSATTYNGVSSGTTFASTNLTGFTGTYAADGYMTIKIRMTSTTTTKNVRIGNITLNYLSKY